jgi:hypothetical protein
LHEAAAEALGKIGPLAKDAVPTLVEALKVKNRLEWGEAQKKERLRVEVAKALGRIGPAARAALPALRKASKEKRWWDERLFTCVGDALPAPQPGVVIRPVVVDPRFQPEVLRAIKKIEGSAKEQAGRVSQAPFATEIAPQGGGTLRSTRSSLRTRLFQRCAWLRTG